MPTYEVTGPDGRKFEIGAPDGSSYQDAIAKVKSMHYGETDPVPVTAGDIARHSLQGATLNFGDELRAGASAALGSLTGQGDFSDLYDVTRDYERRKAAEFSEAHPVVATGAELLGGAATGILGGIKATATTGGKALAANMAAKGIRGRAKLAAGAGAATGGAGGAIAGAGAANELEDVAGDAARGGLLGLATGAAIAPGVEVVGTGLRKGAEVIRRARDPEFQAAKNIERAIERSGMDAEETLMRTAALGDDAVLADASAATRESLESMANQPGATQDRALGLLAERSSKQGGELMSDLGPGKKYETVDALKTFRREEASPQYEKAFNKGVPHTQVLEDVFEDLDAFEPGLWKKAKRLGKLSLANNGEKIADDALGNARPSLRGWQYIKEHLDDRVESLRRSGDNKAADALSGTRRRMLNEIDSLNPDFAQARAKWAGAAQFEEMLNKANRFMTISGAEFESMMKGMTPIDREAVRIGAIQAIEDKIERGQWTHDAAKLFRTPAMKRKMSLLFDDKKDFANFLNKLKAATEKQRTFDAVRGNSATARRQAAEKESNSWVDKLINAAEGLSSPTEGVKKGAGLLARHVGKIKPGMSEEAREATAALLLEADPAARLSNLHYGRGLLNAPLPQSKRPLLAPGIGGLLGTTTAVGAFP